MLLRSFYLVSVLTVYCSFVVLGVDAFHASKPIVYINFYDDEIMSDSNSLKLEENEPITSLDTTNNLKSEVITTFKEEVSKLAKYSVPSELITTSKEEFSKSDKYSKPSEVITTSKEFSKYPKPSDVITTSKEELSKSAKDLLKLFPSLKHEAAPFKLTNIPETRSEVPKVEFSGAWTPESTGTEIPDVGTEINQETSDLMSMQFTKIYLKAITTLIQHIMDALFSINESTANSRFGDSYNFDSDPIIPRKLKKRDTSNMENELSTSTVSSSEEIITSNFESSAGEDSATDKTVITSLDISAKEADGLGGESLETFVSSQGEISVISSSSNPPREIESPNILEKLDGKTKVSKNDKTESTLHDKTDIKSQASITDNPPSASVSDKSLSSTTDTDDMATDVTDIDSLKKILFQKKKHSKPTVKDDLLLIDDLINDDSSKLVDPVTKDETPALLDINAEEYNNPKFVQQPTKGDNDLEHSNSGLVLIITGTVLIVIVLASAGVVGAYLLRKRRLNLPRSQHPSGHRTTMA